MQTALALEAPARTWLHDLRQVVQSLETVTLAGQRHDMTKVIVLLERAAIDARWDRSSSQHDTIAALLTALRFEAGRLVPEVRVFAAKAEVLIRVVEHAL